MCLKCLPYGIRVYSSLNPPLIKYTRHDIHRLCTRYYKPHHCRFMCISGNHYLLTFKCRRNNHCLISTCRAIYKEKTPGSIIEFTKQFLRFFNSSLRTVQIISERSLCHIISKYFLTCFISPSAAYTSV